MPREVQIKLATKIAELRKKTGLTQEDLAKTVDVKRSTVSMWESGQSMPRAELIPKLAEALGCSIDEIFE